LAIDLEPHLLRCFLAVAEELHFGRAAARLYISQPSLSNQIHKLERTLGADLFVRDSGHVELTTAGRAVLEEAPLALAALDRAAQRARLAGAGVAGTVRLAYTPAASYETLRTILAAVEDDNPNMTILPSELFSAQIPGRVLAGKVDVGIALLPETMTGVRSEPLRVEPLVLLLGKRHRLADASVVPLASLENETLLLFPRELAPAHYDRIIAACEQAGFEPRVRAFPDPPPHAMFARLPAGREVCFATASFAVQAAAGEPSILAREIAAPGIMAEWSILWSARARSAAITRFLDSARRCAAENNWLFSPRETSGAQIDAASPAPL
jgi:DNA-binding transcriptional LysR family regulator